MRNLIARLVVWAHRRCALRNARLRDKSYTARGLARAELSRLYADAAFLDRLDAGQASAVHKMHQLYATLAGKPFRE